MLPASPLYFAFRNYEEIKWNFYTGLAIIAFGVVMEAIADQQLYNFSKRMSTATTEIPAMDINKDHELINQEAAIIKKTDKEIYRQGLWSKSRHPNLFYELVAWIGFTIYGLNDWSFLISIGYWIHWAYFFVRHNVLCDHPYN